MATAGFSLWSTTASSNASSDSAVNWAEGMAPSAVNDSGRGMMATLAKWRDDLYGVTSGLSTGGSSTAYTVTTNATYASASAMSGAIFSIIPHTTSGASPTLAVDGLTARALNGSTGVAIPAGALVAGTPYLVRYVHATTEFIVIGATKAVLEVLDIINGTQLTAIATDDSFPIYDTSAGANRRILVSDVLKVIAALTADSSPDKNADYVMTYDNSASAAKKVLLSALPATLARGFIDGCTIANNGSDATNDIDFSAGVCRDSTNAFDITCTAMTKQLDANWVAGTNAGMRNSASGIANTTYHLYAVAKADGTQDYYAHASASVATVLTALQAETGGSSYVYARRIGSILRESYAIVSFTQSGDFFQRTTLKQDIAANNPGTTAVSATLSVPAGISVNAKINAMLAQTGINIVYGLLTPLSGTNETPSSSLFNIGPVANAAGQSQRLSGEYTVATNTSGQIRYRIDTSDAGVTVYINTRGWFDARGKDS